MVLARFRTAGSKTIPEATHKGSPHYQKREAPIQFLPTLHIDKLGKILIQSEALAQFYTAGSKTIP